MPYRGDAPIITALLASEVQFAIATPTQAIENVQAGKLRALAVTANTRDDKLPDVPTVEQALGHQGLRRAQLVRDGGAGRDAQAGASTG